MLEEFDPAASDRLDWVSFNDCNQACKVVYGTNKLVTDNVGWYQEK